MNQLTKGCFLFVAVFALLACTEEKTDPLDYFKYWSIYSGDKKGNQYSELDQINRENVHHLEVAWEYHHGSPAGPSMYSNLIVIDGLLYFTTPPLEAVATDALKGKDVSQNQPLSIPVRGD